MRAHHRRIIIVQDLKVNRVFARAVTGGVRSVLFISMARPMPSPHRRPRAYRRCSAPPTWRSGAHGGARGRRWSERTGEDAINFEVLHNNNPPVVSLIGVNSGAQFVTGAKFAVRGSATDPVGVQSIN